MTLTKAIRSRLAMAGMCISLAITAFVGFRARRDTILQLRQEQDTSDAIQAMLDHGSYGYAIVNKLGQVVEWNPALEKLTGWNEADMKGGGLKNVMTGDLWAKHSTAFRAAMEKPDLKKVAVVSCEVPSPKPGKPPVAVRVTVRIVRSRNGNLFAIAQVDRESRVTETALIHKP